MKFELLEDRRMLSVLRVATWNTENRPNVAADDADFRTVLQAIGNESVAGNSARIGLLAVQETDIPGTGDNSIGRIESILEGIYPGSDYGVTVTSIDGGGDATGFVFDTSMLTLLDSVEISNGMTHNTMRAEFRPTGTTGVSDFFMYTTHLKAGTAGSDASTRASEASLLRSNADALGEGTSIIMAGDFNVKRSTEGAYTEFLSAGSGQLQDPISSPGDWNDNSVFRSVHTQDPSGGAGMDDRFDFQLLTGEFFDGAGIDYIAGSYHAFGNNGTHALNGAITTGTGASPGVLSALAAASDHLPVVADYEILELAEGVTIQESGGDTLVAEGGLIDTYSITLNSLPTANVTITVAPDSQLDIGAGAGNSIDLVFTPANALTAQTVVVSAVNDGVLEGTHTALISHSATSSDGRFDGITIASVDVTVIDDDLPSLVINEIDVDTAGIDSMEFVELYDGGIGGLPLDGLTVVFYNGVSDSSYSAYGLDGYTTDANGFFVLGNSATNPDLTFNDNSLQNGADAVAIYLASESDFPNGSAVRVNGLLDAIVYDTDDADDPGLLPLLLPGQPQVNEDQNNDQVNESLARIPDGGAQRETTTFVAQLPTPGRFNQPATSAVVINQSGTGTAVTEGGAADTYTLALTTLPASNVEIVVAPDDQLDVGAGPGMPVTLTFSPSNGIVPQTVSVTAVDDSLVEGAHFGVISHTATSSDPAYDEVAINNVTVSITDNEVTPTESVVISEIMYNPVSDEMSPGVGEWVEIVNVGNVGVDLGGWILDDEDSTDWGSIPMGATLGIHQVAVLFDSAFATEAEFRQAWNVPSESLVIGVTWGSLANSPSPTSEILQLIDNQGEVKDQVNYDDTAPWPSDSPQGSSIYLIDLAFDNDMGQNWNRSSVGTDQAIHPSAAPFDSGDIGSPGRVQPLLPDGDIDDNGIYDCDDIDAIVAQIALATYDAAFDLTGDGVLDGRDITAWLAESGAANVGPGRSYSYGDANLDGFVDVSDLVIWNASKFTNTAAWCAGDFNADGVVDITDYGILNSHRFTSAARPVRQLPPLPAVKSRDGGCIADVDDDEAGRRGDRRVAQQVFEAAESFEPTMIQRWRKRLLG